MDSRNKVKVVAFRCDSTMDHGGGHIYRCLILAKEFRNNGTTCIFISSGGKGNLNHIAKKEGFSVYELQFDDLNCKEDKSHDATATISILQQNRCTLVIVDSYKIGCHWEKLVASKGYTIVVIDDLYDRKHYAKIYINNGLSADSSFATQNLAPKSCIPLLGPRYAIINERFYNSEGRWNISNGHRPQFIFFVFMGSSDTTNETEKAVAAICHFTQKVKHVNCVVSSNYSFSKSLLKELNKLPSYNLLQQISNLPNVMSECNIGITSGGMILYERCLNGLPGLTTITGENQKPNCDKLEKLRGHIVVGDSIKTSSLDYEKALCLVTNNKLYEQSAVCSKIFDTKGKSRIVQEIFNLIK